MLNNPINAGPDVTEGKIPEPSAGSIMKPKTVQIYKAPPNEPKPVPRDAGFAALTL